MSRNLPRSFFWIDQHLIRSGIWLNLGAEARLTYIAIAASCDRQGISIWSRNKLMELSACKDPEEWEPRISELLDHKLIELLPENSPPAIRLIGFQSESPNTGRTGPHRLPDTIPAPVIVHTYTTINLGNTRSEGTAPHVESRNSD